MDFRMAISRHKAQIGNSIICLVAVNVVNNLIVCQRSAKMLFHDVSMLRNTLPVHCYKLIASAEPAFSIGTLLYEVRVAIARKAKVVLVAVTTAPYRLIAFPQLADIGLAVLDKTARFRVLNNSLHILSSLICHSLQQTRTVVKKNDGANRVNCQETLTDNAEGNLQPSSGYTLRRFTDYWRGRVPLITSLSARLERDEIVGACGNAG